jgi:hypothetical protein
MLETNDEWTVARRYMSLATRARVNDTPSGRPPWRPDQNPGLPEGRRSYTMEKGHYP